jgi:hypothetical protein
MASTEPQGLYSRAIPLLPLWAIRPLQSLSACTVELYLYSPYGPYGLYRASVLVQGCTLLLCLLIFVRRRVDPRAMVRPEELFQWKVPMTPSGIEPATFRLVVQCLKQLRHRLPLFWDVTLCNLVLGYQCFGINWCLLLQGIRMTLLTCNAISLQEMDTWYLVTYKTIDFLHYYTPD